MDKILDTYFRKISIEKILSNYVSNCPKSFYYESPKNILDESNHFSEYNKEEKENIFSINQDKLKLDNIEESSIFSLLVNYAQKCLREIEKEPICRYNELLNWSETTRHLGEELITTAFFAYSDIISNKKRNFFAWKPITSSDNTRISNMLKKGIAENHCHLKASAQHDSISWISLMNNITNRSNDFKDLLKIKKEGADFYNLIKKACIIRQHFFKLLEEKELEKDNKSKIPEIKELFANDFINIFLPEIQAEINSLKLIRGFSFNIDGKNKVPDYYIKKEILESNFNGNIFLCGERYFLYSVFKSIFSDELKEENKELFYIYLIIKSKFREKLIQLNNKVGLSNFIDYETKKETFIKEGSIYEKFLHNIAIASSIKNQNIVSLEGRITPKNTKKDISKAIKTLDKNISLDVFHKADFSRFDSFIDKLEKKEVEKNHVHFYTLHFIKKIEKELSKELEKFNNKPRFFKLRKEIKTQAHAIMKLRESISTSSQRIFGIDSACTEIGIRPEIFAQVFRFLKDHNINNKNEYIRDLNVPKLGSTFHAGEDFLDILDGLRYIDEAIKFANLEQGDRLGHALALGIDAKDYYCYKNQKLFLPKQDLLDNIVWLLAKIRKYSINDINLTYSLEKKYNRLFSEIYHCIIKNQINNDSYYLSSIPNHSTYFNSWKLRGDNPILYSQGTFDKNFLCLTTWDKYSINKLYPKNSKLREINEVSHLYHLYHYNTDVRKAGAKIEEFEVEANYIKAIHEIQKAMQFEIAKKGIGIETNPSSNYIISSFKKYSKHPIIKWFNLGLEIDPEKIKNSPQLFVSINTDDQGIFNTYLENEYTLLALALEKEKDDFGKNLYNTSMIYEWLDKIRQMGIEQSFKKR
ncbi:MAG: hypothetical protein AABZ74_05605 [Cyanobacteriota bacterium]